MNVLPADLPWPPVVGILGRSDSGKTLLVERLVPRLRERGLHVAVVKHCSHGIDVDHPGKDSDRIFKSGADVLAVGPDETLSRLHTGDASPSRWLRQLPEACDVVLVEGFRETAFPQIRLRGKDDKAEGPFATGGDTLLVLADAEQGSDAAEQAVWDVIARVHAALPTYAVVLVGQSGTRSESGPGRTDAGQTVAQIVAAAARHVRQVVLVGSGPFPEGLPGVARLPAASDAPGPMASVLSAMRWQPQGRWITLGCDPALTEPKAVPWLLSQTRPGVDVVVPALPGSSTLCPLFAAFEPTARPALEQAASQGQWSLDEALAAARVASPKLKIGA